MINILLIAIVALLIIIATALVGSFLDQSSLEPKEIWYTFLGVIVGAGSLAGAIYWVLIFFNLIN